MADAVEAPVVETPAEPREVEILNEALPGVLLKSKVELGSLYLCVARERILDALTLLRDHEELGYTLWSECTGVDYSAWGHSRDFEERFEVVYNIYSPGRGERILVKVGVDDGQTIPSAIPVFMGAEFPEREINDLFGIVFEGNLPRAGQRFMLPDDWQGFPLRKEYPLGGEDVNFDRNTRGPAVEDVMMPHAGESFEGKTGSEDVSGR
ncbi:NADH-quinone oxidoreductase subunit C [bacterium]|nr:MAG: NADH-quinone oxidoreductase subunit C [bacterium]